MGQLAVKPIIRTVPGIAGLGDTNLGDAGLGATPSTGSPILDFIEQVTQPLINAAAVKIQSQPGTNVVYDPNTGKMVTVSQQAPGYPILTGQVGTSTNVATSGSGSALLIGGVVLVGVYLLMRRH